jgi:hypothetical protein
MKDSASPRRFGQHLVDESHSGVGDRSGWVLVAPVAHPQVRPSLVDLYDLLLHAAGGGVREVVTRHKSHQPFLVLRVFVDEDAFRRVHLSLLPWGNIANRGDQLAAGVPPHAYNESAAIGI